MAQSDGLMAEVRKRLELPDDATREQVYGAASVLLAQAEAAEKGTVAAAGTIRGALKLPADAPDPVVLAAADTVMLKAARRLKMSAATPAKDIRAGIEAHRWATEQVAASRRRTAASEPSGQAANLPLATAPVGTTARNGRIAAATTADPTGHYSLNPGASELQVSMGSDNYRTAVEAIGPPPTLFESGDLPPWTSTDLPPEALRAAPTWARHRIAAAATKAEQLAVLESVSGPNGLYAYDDFKDDPGNASYRSRLTEWQLRADNVIETQRQQDAALAESARAERVAAAVGDPEDWTDEQMHEHLFGEIDRRAAARKAEHAKAYAEGRVVGLGMRPSRPRGKAQ